MQTPDALNPEIPRISESRNLLARVVDTFIAPRALCSRLRDGGPWLDVLIISTIVVVIAVAAQPAEVFIQQMQNPVTRRGEPVQITSSPAEIVRYGRLMAMLSVMVAHPIVAFAIAGILTLIFSGLGRGRASFRDYLAITSHALLIPALGVVIALLVQAFRGAPPPHGLSFLVPEAERGGFVGALLAQISVFQLWAIAVLALGVQVLDGRRSWLPAAAVLTALYLIMKTGIALGA